MRAFLSFGSQLLASCWLPSKLGPWISSFDTYPDEHLYGGTGSLKDWTLAMLQFKAVAIQLNKGTFALKTAPKGAVLGNSD